MKLKVQAQHLQPGDIVGSGEKVYCTSVGISTPKGKVEVYLKNKNDIGELGQVKHWDRMSLWGKYTEINVERANATP